MKLLVIFSAVLLSVWNAALVMSISATFLGFIWNVETLGYKMLFSVPLTVVAGMATYRAVRSLMA